MADDSGVRRACATRDGPKCQAEFHLLKDISTELITEEAGQLGSTPDANPPTLLLTPKIAQVNGWT
jgi:hypothetical protein